jgi:hypothetical protein
MAPEKLDTLADWETLAAEQRRELEDWWAQAPKNKKDELWDHLGRAGRFAREIAGNMRRGTADDITTAQNLYFLIFG